MKIGFYQSYWGRIGGGQRYTGLAAQILARNATVEFVHHAKDFDRMAIEEALDLDLSAIKFRYAPTPERPVHQTINPFARLRLEKQWCREFSSPYDVFINNSDQVPMFCHARKGVLLTHFPMVTFDEFHGNQARTFSNPLNGPRRIYQRIEWRQRFATYEHYIVNSNYGRRWIRERWGVNADVVYPPLRQGLSSETNKDDTIISIGAFHSSSHKKHAEMINAFRSLVDGGLSDWQYIIVGAGGSSADDRAYLERILELAQGYPITILTNVSGRELNSLLERSAILWHSMGYGVEEQKDPGRLEHFGMVATEAMAAGAIPVVFSGGGLREIVTSDVNGFLWQSLEEMKCQTLRLVHDTQLRARLKYKAVLDSQRFSEAAFERRLLEVLSPVLNGRFP